MTAGERPGPDNVFCPNCGAISRAFRKQCWMCRGLLEGDGRDSRRHVAPPRPAHVRPMGIGWFVTAILASVVWALLLVGLVLESPGWAVAVGCVVVPVAIAVLRTTRPSVSVSNEQRTAVTLGVLLLSIIGFPLLGFVAFVVLIVAICTGGRF